MNGQTTGSKDYCGLFCQPACFEGVALRLFCTRGRNTLSDVDILVVLDHTKPVGLKFFGMWNDLEKLLDRKVDLVTEGSLAPFAVESANRDKILIYERAA